MANRNRIINSDSCKILGIVDGLCVINCTDLVFDARHSGQTWIGNARVLHNVSRTYTSDAAQDAESVNGDYNTYYVDTTNDDGRFKFDAEALTDCEIMIKIIDGAGTVIIDGVLGTELFEDELVPVTTEMTCGETIVIKSDGTNLFIKSLFQ